VLFSLNNSKEKQGFVTERHSKKETNISKEKKENKANMAKRSSKLSRRL
jgi:hypothetical protein